MNATSGYNPMAATGPEQWVINGVPFPVAATYYLALKQGELQYTIEVPVADIPESEDAALLVAWPYMRQAFEQKLYQRTSITSIGGGPTKTDRIGVALFHKDGVQTRGMRVALSLDEIRRRVANDGSGGASR